MERALAEAVGRALGTSVRHAQAVAGGDIHRAFHVTLGDGREAFVKTSEGAPRGMFAAEAEGLRWLAAPGAIAVPEVLAVLEAPPALVLAWITPGRTESPEALGRGLAALHRASPAAFGLAAGNWLATLPQDNRPSERWSAFYAERRLVPLLARAVDRGAASPRMQRGIAWVVAHVDELVGSEEAPARLHGDLWSGNVVWGEGGRPWLVDPAAYGGHREIDLAMMRLFGGFSARTFDAYAEAFPLAAGHEERLPLYQLLPLLAHCALFGGSYVSGVEAALARLGAA
ncbi:MAG: fructosamine kinase family protein [Sandaracinus sp.]